MNKVIILLLCFIAGPLHLRGQSPDQPYWLSVNIDNHQSGTFFPNPLHQAFRADNPSFTLAGERYINNFIDLSGNLTMGKISNNLQPYEFSNVRANFSHLGANVILKLNNGYILSESAVIAPFVSSGLGLIHFSETRSSLERGVVIALPVKVGTRIRISERVKLNLGLGQIITRKMAFRQYSAGVSFSLNRSFDTDKDGVTDREDECPEEFGAPTNFGCPYADLDEDGIADADDACPLLAGSINGCPDTDGDGIPDREDLCPDQPGKLKGCPDRDGDGIPDHKDKCPEAVGTPATKGCPKGSKAVRLPVERLYFSLNSTEISPTYKASLRLLAGNIPGLDSLTISITGHTDNTGRPLANLRLSERRAQKVAEFLIRLGVDPEQMVVSGLGEKEPVATNHTTEGRAANRRVEMEALRK